MDLRYPIGPYSPPSTIRRTELDSWISELEALTGNLRNAAEGLSDDQLDKHIGPAVGPFAKSYTIFPMVT